MAEFTVNGYSWLSANSLANEGSTYREVEVDFDVKTHTGRENRVANLKVVDASGASKSLTVTQKAAEIFLNLNAGNTHLSATSDDTFVIFEGEGNMDEFKLVADPSSTLTGWSISDFEIGDHESEIQSANDHVTASNKTISAGEFGKAVKYDYAVEISFPQNLDAEPKTLTLSLQDSEGIEYGIVNIVQDGADATLTVDPNKIFFNAAGAPVTEAGVAKEDGDKVKITSNTSWEITQ